MHKAAFGAGCFWGVEETFRTTKGVKETAAGYMGGRTKDPTYREVCNADTGHAEVVYLEYDPAEITYEQLLDVFWKNHNPTTINRQGPDFGSQYRSVIFYYTHEQKALAEASKEKMDASGKWQNPIVTQIVEAPAFYKAEDYHQKYLMKKGLQSCHI